MIATLPSMEGFECKFVFATLTLEQFTNQPTESENADADVQVSETDSEADVDVDVDAD